MTFRFRFAKFWCVGRPVALAWVTLRCRSMSSVIDGLMFVVLMAVNTCAVKFVFNGFALRRFCHQSVHLQLACTITQK